MSSLQIFFQDFRVSGRGLRAQGSQHRASGELRGPRDQERSAPQHRSLSEVLIFALARTRRVSRLEFLGQPASSMDMKALWGEGRRPEGA